jgi:hypothetical protein
LEIPFPLTLALSHEGKRGYKEQTGDNGSPDGKGRMEETTFMHQLVFY